MNLKGQITMTAALAVSALAFAGTAAGQDAHERSAGNSGQAAIGYFIENERATLIQPGSTGVLATYADGPQRTEPFVGTPGKQAIEYFRTNELATLAQPDSNSALVAYVDGPERSEPLVGTPGETIVAADDSGFDWGSAMVGASSALVLALLIGVSLVTVRRFRTGPLAH